MRTSLTALSHSIRHSPDFAASIKHSSLNFLIEENPEGEKLLVMSLEKTIHENIAALTPEFSQLIMQISQGKFHIRRSLISKNAYGLTKREVSVLNALKSGATSKEISLHLFISEATTKTHLGSIYRKFGVSNRTQAISLGLSSGVITK
jgi:DNA-binding CsgD family transcriptional regulator